MKKLQNLLNPDFEYQRPQGSMTDLQIRLLQGLPPSHNPINVEAHLPINKNAIPGIFYNPLEKQNPFINNNPQNFLSSVFQQLPNYPERINTPNPNHDLAFGLFNNTNNNSHATSNSMFLQQETLLNSSLRNSQLLSGAGGVQPKTLEELFQKSTLITTPRSTAPSVFSSTPSPYLQMNNYSLNSYQNAPLHSAESLLTLSPAFGQPRPQINNPGFPLQQHDQSANRELVSQLVEVLKRDNQNKVRSLLETLIVPHNGVHVSPGINQNNHRPGVGFGSGLESLLAQPKNLVSQVQDIPPQRFTPIQKNQQQHQNQHQNQDPHYPQVKEEQKKPERISLSTTNSLNDIVQRLGNLSGPGGPTAKDPKDIVHNLEMLVINEEPKGFEQEEEQDMMESYRQRGVYSKEERRQKILKYKNKIAKWRNSHPVKRAFSGRSNVAGKKPRIKGKFVSTEEYEKYTESQAK